MPQVLPAAPPLTPRIPEGVPPDRLLTVNLSALSACDLDLARRVRQARPEAVPDGVEVRPAASGWPTVIAARLHLHSAEDPVAEAELLAAQVPEDAERVTVLGVGAGHLLAALLSRPRLRRLDVAVMNAAVLRGIAQSIDLRPLLCDSRLRFLSEDGALGPVSVAVPPLLRLAEPGREALREAALDAQAVAAVRARRGPPSPEDAPGESPLGALAGRHSGALALLCAGGPSLLPAMGALAAAARAGAGRAVIVATDGALPLLLRAGVPPAYVTTTGRPGAAPSVPGGVTVLRAPPGVLDIHDALCLALHAARALGAAGVGLVGADLCAPPDEPAGRRRHIPGVAGGAVAASTADIATRVQLEAAIRGGPEEPRVYNTAPAGAVIAGATGVRLEDLLDRWKVPRA